jgi:hypothetical protein
MLDGPDGAQITAAIVATVATGGVVSRARRRGRRGRGRRLPDSPRASTSTMESAAEKVALDLEIADISINEPR